MSEIDQLEKRVRGLSSKDFARFRAWFVEFDARAWDEQIEADLKAGKLDEVIAESLADFRAGKAREL